MAEADKFSAALNAVRRAIRDHLVSPGEALHVDHLAHRLRISATPIREALAYLSGAGVAERQSRGYRVHRLEPHDVIELYELHQAYVLMALEGASGAINVRVGPLASEISPHDIDYRTQVESFWAGLVETSGRLRLRRALSQVSDQLALVRIAESFVLNDVGPELSTLRRLERGHSAETLFAAVRAYHVRRVAAATALSAAVYWPLDTRKI